jgi:hypothetical protein
MHPAKVRPDRPSLQQCIGAFVQLGRVFHLLARDEPWPGTSSGLVEQEYRALADAMARAGVHNPWYTPDNVRHALASLAHMLHEDRMGRWLGAYPQLGQERSPGTIGLLLAGNVPMVGFHDVMCVLLPGHRARLKCSSQEPELVPAVLQVLEQFAPGITAGTATFDGRMGEVDAVIATGTNNSARHFAHYFAHVPRIIRSNRSSVAVLDGTESPEELAALGGDVFRYFGLGCRNVSKLFVPVDFDLDRLFEAFLPWQHVIDHAKYANNYTFDRAVWLLDGAAFLDNGFLLLKEDDALVSPMAAVYYERYTDRNAVEQRLAALQDELQCVVGHGHLPFGQAQCPGPDDYADGVDTLRFLLEEVKAADQGHHS